MMNSVVLHSASASHGNVVATVFAQMAHRSRLQTNAVFRNRNVLEQDLVSLRFSILKANDLSIYNSFVY